MAKESSSDEENPVTVIAAISANLLIAVAKFVAAIFSGSSAMLSEGIHSVVDTGNQVLLLVGVKRSAKAPDLQHPLGYGKERYFWSLIVAVLLFGIGGGMSIYEGIHHLQHPGEGGNVIWSYAVLGIAFLAEGASWIIAIRAVNEEGNGDSFIEKLNRSKSPEKFVVVGEDSAALAGIVAALVGITLSEWLHSPVPDAIASMVIGSILCATAVYLVVQSKKLLIGETADPEMVRAIREMVRERPGVEEVDYPLTMHFGPEEVLVNLDVRFDRELGSLDVAREIDAIEEAIHERFPSVRRIYVEAQVDASGDAHRDAFASDPGGLKAPAAG